MARGVWKLGVGVAAVLTTVCASALGQAARPDTAGLDAAEPRFVAADVQPSPHMMFPYTRATFHGGMYVIRQATLVDLISRAYGADAGNIAGGPSWLELDRFDINAKAPAKTSPDAIKPMLRALLAERFNLVAHADSKPLPAYVLSVAKGGAKMTEGEGDGGCRYIQAADAGPEVVPLYTFHCSNTTMEALADHLHEWAGDYLANPVVDATGLKGAWNFDLHFHSKQRYQRAGPDGVSIFDALEKQLGLKLEAKTAPQPVIFVDGVNEQPTPNAADVAKLLPPRPPAEFEVATIRVSAPDAKMQARIDGGQASLQAGTLRMMITYAYDISDEMLVGAPKFVDTAHFDLIAKAARDESEEGPGAPEIYPDDLRLMVRKLLIDRFGLVAHMEDRPFDAYTLEAADPRLKRADPAERTGCNEGPGANGKDPRLANPVLDRLLTCRNMTLTQLAGMLPRWANGYVRTPVLDATGIPGAYDFTLSFSSIQQMQSRHSGPPPPNPPPTGGTAGVGASEPNGAMTLPEAMRKELGLKLVKEKRPVPVLVIDHLNDRPTEN